MNIFVRPVFFFNPITYNCHFDHMSEAEQNGCSRYFCPNFFGDMETNYKGAFVASVVVRCEWLAVLGLCDDRIGSSLSLWQWNSINV